MENCCVRENNPHHQDKRYQEWLLLIICINYRLQEGRKNPTMENFREIYLYYQTAMISTKSISKLTTLRHIEVGSLYRVMLLFSNLQNMQTGGLLRNRSSKQGMKNGSATTTITNLHGKYSLALDMARVICCSTHESLHKLTLKPLLSFYRCNHR